MKFIYFILLFALAIIFHEFGHYLAFRLCKKKPDIKLKWYGVIIGENIWHSLIPVQAFVISISGILLGGLVAMWDYELFLIYLVACCIDIVNVLSLTNLPKEYNKLTLLKISKLQIKELEKKIKNEINNR